MKFMQKKRKGKRGGCGREKQKGGVEEEIPRGETKMWG